MYWTCIGKEEKPHCQERSLGKYTSRNHLSDTNSGAVAGTEPTSHMVICSTPLYTDKLMVLLGLLPLPCTDWVWPSPRVSVRGARIRVEYPGLTIGSVSIAAGVLQVTPSRTPGCSGCASSTSAGWTVHLGSLSLPFKSPLIGHISYYKPIAAEAIDTSNVSETFLSPRETDCQCTDAVRLARIH